MWHRSSCKKNDRVHTSHTLYEYYSILLQDWIFHVVFKHHAKATQTILTTSTWSSKVIPLLTTFLPFSRTLSQEFLTLASCSFTHCVLSYVDLPQMSWGHTSMEIQPSPPWVTLLGSSICSIWYTMAGNFWRRFAVVFNTAVRTFASCLGTYIEAKQCENSVTL